MKHKKINIYNFDDEPVYLSKLPCYFYFTCCHCKLRHIVIVERYKKGIRLGFAVDEHATEQRRELEGIKVTQNGK